MMYVRFARGVCALISALLAAGQDTKEITLRTTTQVVSLDVVVRDKSGKPVRGLTAADFTVLDDGKPQEIRIFREFNAAAPAKDEPASAFAARLPATLPPDVFTNRTSGQATPQSVTVILLDGLNTPIEDQRYARQQIVKFLEQVKPDDRIGLYVLGSQKLWVLHDFTSDARSLLRQIGKYGGETLVNTETDNSLSALMNDRKLDEILNQGGAERAHNQIAADQQNALLQLERRIETTLGALEGIAQHMAAAPGRKNLLWVSAAFPTIVATDIRTGTGSPQTFAKRIDRTARAIANTGVAIYPIDARGVMVDVLYRAKTPYKDYAMAQVLALSRSRGMRRGGGGTFGSADPMVYQNRDETQAHHDVMRELANRTGGRAYITTNDTSRAVRDAIDESGDQYTIAYYPNPYEENGKFHRIQVKVRDGATVRHREGYFAASDKKAGAQENREALWDLMRSPLQVSAVPMLVQCRPVDGKMRVMMKFDPAGITLRESKGKFAGQLDLVLFYLDPTGASKGGVEQSLPLELTAADREQAMGSGFNYGLDLPLIAEANRLVIGVRDVLSGRVGTVQVELAKVPGAGKGQ